MVVDSGVNVILVLKKYNKSSAGTTESDSVPHYLTEGQRVLVQSYAD